MLRQCYLFYKLTFVFILIKSFPVLGLDNIGLANVYSLLIAANCCAGKNGILLHRFIQCLPEKIFQLC